MTKDKQKEKPTPQECLARALYECKVPQDEIEKIVAFIAVSAGIVELKKENSVGFFLTPKDINTFSKKVEAAYILIENDEEGGVLAY